jgi:FAD/FMN-containing dehydrogenase
MSIEAQAQKVAKILEGIVGPENVTTEPADLISYTSGYPGPLVRVPKDFQTAHILVRPTATSQVPEIIKIANKEKFNVVPFSALGFLGIGNLMFCTSPIMAVDLKQLKGIEVFPEDGYAIIEPGVTMAEMYRYLKANHPDWVLPAVPTALPSATVIGNYIWSGDGNGPGYYSRFGQRTGNNEDFVLGMEVALPTGGVVRLGNLSWRFPNAFPHGIAFQPMGLFMGSWGSTGIVTKLSIMLCPKPYAMVSRLYGLETIEQCIDAAYKLARHGVFPYMSYSHWLLAAWMRADKTPYPFEITGGKSALPHDFLAKWREELGFPGRGPEGWYIIATHTCRDEFEVEAMEKTIAKAEREWNLKQIDTERFIVPRVEFEMKELMASGSPGVSRSRYMSSRGGGVMWSIGYPLHKDIPALVRKGYPIAEKYGFNPAVHGYVYAPGRYCHIRFIMPFNQSDPDEIQRILATTAEIGATWYHQIGTPGHAFTILYPGHISECDPGYACLIDQLRDLLDPNRIMQPMAYAGYGKYGARPSS